MNYLTCRACGCDAFIEKPAIRVLLLDIGPAARETVHVLCCVQCGAKHRESDPAESANDAQTTPSAPTTQTQSDKQTDAGTVTGTGNTGASADTKPAQRATRRARPQSDAANSKA